MAAYTDPELITEIWDGYAINAKMDIYVNLNLSTVSLITMTVLVDQWDTGK